MKSRRHGYGLVAKLHQKRPPVPIVIAHDRVHGLGALRGSLASQHKNGQSSVKVPPQALLAPFLGVADSSGCLDPGRFTERLGDISEALPSDAVPPYGPLSITAG